MQPVLYLAVTVQSLEANLSTTNTKHVQTEVSTTEQLLEAVQVVLTTLAADTWLDVSVEPTQLAMALTYAILLAAVLELTVAVL